jgi:tRNA modification GTPase
MEKIEAPILPGNSDVNDVIVAQCTPQGSGALAVIRVTGHGAVSVVDLCASLSSCKKLSECLTYTIHHGYIIDQEISEQENNNTGLQAGVISQKNKNNPDQQAWATPQITLNKNNIIDEVLFFLMRAPKTFSGQDTVEISCHNNQFVIEKIMSRLIACGARVASPGEFCKRAVLAGKIDLIQAEAINELICASNEQEVRRALEQVKGTLSHEFYNLEKLLIETLTLVEASFEFLEEEEREYNLLEKIKDKIKILDEKIKLLIEGFYCQEHIKKGIRIALVGDVNVGKSTLFNVLVGKDRAIVTDIAGTTRDTIEESIYRNGIFWTFVDTAGIRSTSQTIEQEGISRTYNEIDKSDIVLLVIDDSIEFSCVLKDMCEKIIRKYTQKCITVYNKIDKSGEEKSSRVWEGLAVSAKFSQGIDKLISTLDTMVYDLCEKHLSPYLLTQRQFRLLQEISHKLSFVVKEMRDNLNYEIIACQLKELLEKVSELTGKNITEQVLDCVFKDFCVGK